MGSLQHHKIKRNGIELHMVEQGTGPLVLLLHGFPEFWYSWRHQITFLANQGYRVIAPDLRGFGDSEAPQSSTSYSVAHIAGDIISILDHFGEEKAFVVGHDWGALAGWFLCLSRPDRVKGFVSISVPYFPRDPNAKPTQSYRQMFGDGFYINQFQV